MTKNTGIKLVLAAVVAMASGACGTAPMDSVVDLKTVKTKKAAVKTPVVNVIQANTVVMTSPEHATMKLEFNVMPEARQLLAVEAQAAIPEVFDRVEFTVTCESLPKPLTATVTRAQFLNGKAVLQFNNLPPGKLTVTAVAKDKNGAKLIEANGTGTVKIGELTLVKMNCVMPPKAGAGHARIEMDCFSQDCLTGPAPTPSGFVPYPVKQVAFRSLGDPHEEGANDLKFSNQLTGSFLALKTLTNDFTLVKHQAPATYGPWVGTTVNVAVAIHSGKDVFLYFLYNHRARLNAAKLPLTTGQTVTAPEGLKIGRVASPVGMTVLSLTTPQGDQVTIEDRGHFLNIIGKVGAERVVHEVSGEFGTYNNGTPAEGMLMRNGTKAATLDGFLNDWRVNWQENLFLGEGSFFPEGADLKPLDAYKPLN